MTVDPLEIVRAWLVAEDTALSALVGARVYYPWLPENPPGTVNGFDNRLAGLVLVTMDGEPLAESVVQSVDVEIRCFGGGDAARKEPRDAWAVYEALRDRLCDENGEFVTGISLAAGRLIGCEEAKSGTYAVEPGLRWPYVSSNWTFETSAA